MSVGLRPVFGDRARRRSPAFHTRRPTAETAARLGYDTRPELRSLDGNWLPPCYHPLPLSDTSARVALCVWWNGPAWTVLRNSSFFLWRVWDYGSSEQVDFALDHVPESAWLRAIDDAVPGEVSRGSTTLWALRFEMISLSDYIDWPDTAHLRDYRPLSRLTKSQFLDRVRYCNAQRQRTSPRAAIPPATRPSA